MRRRFGVPSPKLGDKLPPRDRTRDDKTAGDPLNQRELRRFEAESQGNIGMSVVIRPATSSDLGTLTNLNAVVQTLHARLEPVH
jgi:hypothetical protein